MSDFNRTLALHLLRTRGSWPGNWDIGNHRTTAGILESLVRRGQVERFQVEPNGPAHYKIKES